MSSWRSWQSVEVVLSVESVECQLCVLCVALSSAWRAATVAYAISRPTFRADRRVPKRRSSMISSVRQFRWWMSLLLRPLHADSISQRIPCFEQQLRNTTDTHYIHRTHLNTGLTCRSLLDPTKALVTAEANRIPTFSCFGCARSLPFCL
jgi:hypothetical protein